MTDPDFPSPSPQRGGGKKVPSRKIVAIGASIGGPHALQVLLSTLPNNLPCGILIVQHLLPGFIESLVEWLKTSSTLNIRVAAAGDRLGPGKVLFAPDDYQIRIDMERRIVLNKDMAKPNLHIPSIDVMMRSVAEVFGKEAIGIIMTGMGRDGVEGIKAIKQAGGRTIAQDAKTSAVFGMNREAIETGCVDTVVSLDGMADEIVRMLSD